jgi:ATP-dependent Lhr-like helicase
MPKETKKKAAGIKVIHDWLGEKGLKPFAFQEQTWNAFLEGKSGLVNAPTGYGKTFSVFLAVLIEWMNEHPRSYKAKRPKKLQLLWVTPLRALSKDIKRAMEEVIEELGMSWEVGLRTGDTSSAEKSRQMRQQPEIMLITPESLHLLIARKDHEPIFESLRCIAVDEWHELLGSKRGVQVELGVARLKKIRSLVMKQAEPPLRIWGISATIGNLEEACQVLLGDWEGGTIIRAQLAKEIVIETVLPDTVERFPWAGHLGLHLVENVVPLIRANNSTLLFTNVRSQAERWYQALLHVAPDLAGLIALHHSAIDTEARTWVEEMLHEGKLKVVVCTSSLDLGVDFRPVDNIIQVGSPKGVARFLQRAGRSGHAPGARSVIWFVPTHSLEILEAIALKSAIEVGVVENRQPVLLAWDVLVQYIVTRALGGGFNSEQLRDEVLSTHSFAVMTDEEWAWLLAFVTTGGQALGGYEEYHRVQKGIDGIYRLTDQRLARKHRMSVGTIVGDMLMRVRMLSGGFVGTIEESFISRLNPGDAFILAGRRLELVGIKDMDAIVRKSQAKNAIVPSWMGGRLPLSARLGEVLRETYEQAGILPAVDPLISFLGPLLNTQRQLSAIPGAGELLVEMIETGDGHHLFIYPFEGRQVHQALAALTAYRLSRIKPLSFSMAMTDYGFELLSESPIPLQEDQVRELFNPRNWYTDLLKSLNAAELARRKFRDISVISGLIFQGYPGEMRKQRHLQNSSSLIYEVLREEEPNHLLLQQADAEVLHYEVESARLYAALERLSNAKVLFRKPRHLTPFCFPIKVDSLREELSSEQLEDRIKRMQASLGLDSDRM